MLTFLTPAALFGLSLLAIPIIVHLLKPRKVRRTPFSSLRWLRVTQQRLARRIRWHQVLLFLLRASFIVLLVLAAAKPMFNHNRSARPNERFVIVDVSRSMGYQSGEQPNLLETGKRLAASVIAGGGPGDRTALLATGATTRVIGPLTADGQKHLAALANLEPGVTDTNLTSSLDVIGSMLAQRRSGAGVELYFVTDNHQGSWQPDAIQRFFDVAPASDVKAVIVDVADANPQNAWIADGRMVEGPSADRRSLRAQLRCVGGPQERSVRLVGPAGLESPAQNVSIEPGRPAFVDFPLPPDFDQRGAAAEIVLEPADALPGDDRWRIALGDEASLRVLLVEGSSQAGSPVPPGFALRAAIESLSSPERTIRVTDKKFNDIQPEDFRNVDVVLWADVPEISDAALAALAPLVREGLGLGVFLGPGVVPEFYNAKLFSPLDPAAGLLPFPLERVVEVPLAQGGLSPVRDIQWTHPLLSGLYDPVLGDLGEWRVRSYYTFGSSPTDADAVLASAPGQPAVVEHDFGAGKVILFNTTADDAWSDLPRRKSFVPLVDRLLGYLSGGVARRSFEAGSKVALSIEAPGAGETLSVSTPGGATITPSIRSAGRRVTLQFPALTEPGVYQIKSSGESSPARSFIVQVGRGDSMIAPVKTDLLRSWWQPAEFEIFRADGAIGRLPGGSTQLWLVAVLAALACLIFAGEMFLVHWLCPRVNPAATVPLVHRPRPAVSRVAGDAASGSRPLRAPT